MSILRAKSDENIRAASELVNKHECYASSVHCSYYACFQLIAYLLKEVHGIKDTRKWRDLGSTKGSHEETTNQFVQQLKARDLAQNPRTRYARSIGRYMETLRNLRHKADYQEEAIDAWTGRFVYDEAVKTRQLLIEAYKLTPISDGSN